MIERINKLKNLYERLEKREPMKASYDLGKGKERSELLVTYSDGDTKITQRIDSSHLVKLCRDNVGISMDMTDSNKNKDEYSYKNLTPQGATYDFPIPDAPDDLGSLKIGLGEDRYLGISHYQRAA